MLRGLNAFPSRESFQAIGRPHAGKESEVISAHSYVADIDGAAGLVGRPGSAAGRMRFYPVPPGERGTAHRTSLAGLFGLQASSEGFLRKLGLRFGLGPGRSRDRPS